MVLQDLILAEKLCSHYKIELSFIDDLNNLGLLKIETIEHEKFIHQDNIGNLEKMIRLHQDLNINLEGIDIVLNLLENEMRLKKEINSLKNKLRIYEDEF